MKNARTSQRETTTKRVSIRMVFMLMAAAVFVLAASTNLSAATITVPDDYPTIQQAINAAIPGDTVYVRSGTYYEHVTIGKSLTLQGENRDTTIIDAGGTGKAIYVTANYVNIEGMTTTNGDYGIYLIPNWSINHIVIGDCIVTLNTQGINGTHVGGYITIENCELSKNKGLVIYSHQFRNSVVRNCQVFENGQGIDIAWCSNSSIVDCDVYSNNATGIMLDSTWDCIVEGCHVRDNEGAGIYIYRWGYGYNNTVRNNVVSHNGVGFSLGGPTFYNNLVYHNDIICNGMQASDHGSANNWDNGYPSGGNYWSDYTGLDLYSGLNQDEPGSDGIGDTPYMIPGTATSRDNYPLMTRWNAVSVEIDIKPGSYPNPINPGSNGLVPVAILSSEAFDATQVAPTSVVLAGAGVAVRGKGKSMAHEEDVNGDGLIDLLVQVETQSFGDLGDGGMVELTGETYDHQVIVGEDEIVIVPPE